MKKVLSYCAPWSAYLGVTLAFKITGTLMDLVIPYLLGYILDDVVPICTREHLGPVFFWGGIMILCAVAALLSNTYANRRAAFFSKSVQETLRNDLFRKTLSLSARQTDSFTASSLVSRISSDVLSIFQFCLVTLRTGVRGPILFVGGIVITLCIEPVLSLTLILLLPLMAAIIMYISKKGTRLFKEKQKSVDKMVGKVRDTFTGIRVIKALSRTEYEKESFAKINQELSHREQVAAVTLGISPPVINIFLNLGMTGVVALGAVRVQSGHATPGQIISFMSYFTIILNATLMLNRIFSTFSMGAASADRIREVLETEDPLPLLPSPAQEGSAFLEFRNVTFSYNKILPTVKNISFTLQKGETLGIIGGTGCGKSTLLNLLLRFYDPDEGDIYLEGKNLSEQEMTCCTLLSIPKEDLRRRFGVVFQNDFLLGSSLRENIDFARGIPEEEIGKATVCAQAAEFIRDTKEGLSHLLTPGGTNLSGGQRQRILLSRALAGDPDILVLDDASSALDYKTDSQMRLALRQNYPDATKIIVAQRVSSIRDADLILVLEHGEISGMGKDAHLAETCQVYREIAHSQMGEMQL